MDCPDYLRLRQNYESAFRRWSQLILSPAGESGYSEAKRRAYEERDEARRQRDAHRYVCRLCNGADRRLATG